MNPSFVESSDVSSEEDEEINQAIQEFLRTPDPVPTRPARTYTPEQLENIQLLKEALRENRAYEAKIKEVQDCMYRMNTEVKRRLQEVGADIMKETNPANESVFSYLRCGKPYFKDKDNFPAPDNEDTIMMKQLQMYDFSQVSSVPGWTVKDKTELVNALQELSRGMKRKQLISEIAKLRRENENNNIVEIAKLEKEITQLSKKSLMEIALPLDAEYDWDALANSLNRRHTAQEYQALWKLFFHPSINKSNWSKTEHQELQKIAVSHNMQNWDVIAKQLNTGRTGYQCFVYYRTNMIDTSTNRRWNSEEIEYLQRVIDYFREGTYIPWGKVATAMDNRTKIQVYNKYTRMMERRKGRFLEEEDIVILNCHDKYGFDFKKISEFLPGRSAVQLRTRFNLLTKFRLSQTWTVDDDKKLIQIMANLDSNASFSTATAHFPGKDRMHIRSRYITLMKWMKAHPATDIAMAPRRGARRLLHGHAQTDLNEALENLNRRMESEVKAKKAKGITKFSREADIEDGITAALINEIIREEANRKPERSELGEESICFPYDAPSHDVSSLRKMLIFLNSELDKDKFDASNYAKKFPGLAEKTPGSSLLKVKSYSKRQGVKTFQLSDVPDIWGNIKLGNNNYVLPPNYATLTGCRVLMKHVGSLPEVSLEDEINLSLMARRNEALKEALCILKERFTSLFLWPMLLSNEAPTEKSINEIYVPKLALQQKLLPQPSGVTIPLPKKVHMIFQEKQARKFGVAKERIDYAKRRKVVLCESHVIGGLNVAEHESTSDGREDFWF